MLSHVRNLAIIVVIVGGAFLFSPEPKQASAADGYWTNYWRWYDNDYRPYYNRAYRNYYYNPGYSSYSNPYSHYNYYRPYYGYNYQRGHGHHHHDGGHIDIGGLHIHWD